METTFDRAREGIIYRCRDRTPVDIPSVDLLTALFELPNERLTDATVIFADAAAPSKAVTKAQQVTLLRRLGHLLRGRYGIGVHDPAHDVVQLLFSGHFLLPTALYGVLCAGGAASASQPSVSPLELTRQLQLTESKLLLCSADLKDIAIEGARKAGLSSDRVLYFGDGPNLTIFEAATNALVPLSGEELDWERVTDAKALAARPAVFVYSSGTTGLPKAVTLSHANMLAQCALIMLETRRNPPKAPYRTLAHLPAAHISGLMGYLINPVYVGGTCYWMKKFDFPAFLQHCKNHRISAIFTVPPVWLAIAKSPLVTDQFDTIDWAMTGAAPLSKEIQLAAQKKLGKGAANLSQTWGLSETCGGFTKMPRDVRDETGSVSMILPMCEARIVDEDGKDVKPGEPGEILVRGPIVTMGYLKNEAANKEAFRDGWFCTGDLCLWKDGLIYCVDRKKELIKYKGSQVAPAELEALLLTHPLVLDAAVIGIEAEGTEVPRAYVVVADPKKVTPRDIVEWVASRASRAKHLRGGVVFVPSVPKSPAGKILRKVLRDQAKKTAEGSKPRL